MTSVCQLRLLRPQEKLLSSAATARARNKALQQSIAEAADASPSHDAHVMDAQVSTCHLQHPRQPWHSSRVTQHLPGPCSSVYAYASAVLVQASSCCHNTQLRKSSSKAHQLLGQQPTSAEGHSRDSPDVPSRVLMQLLALTGAYMSLVKSSLPGWLASWAPHGLQHKQ